MLTNRMAPRHTQFSMLSASFQLCEAANRKLDREIVWDMNSNFLCLRDSPFYCGTKWIID